jgi:transcriptional regulator with XRE-family HTH domain
MSLTREQLRSARALLGLRADDLAEAANVGIATLRRFEAGNEISPLHLDALKRAIEVAGIILIPEGAHVDGRAVGLGVALKLTKRRK